MIVGCSTSSIPQCPPLKLNRPSDDLLVTPILMPRFVGAKTADIVATKQGEIATDTRNRLIRLQTWAREVLGYNE